MKCPYCATTVHMNWSETTLENKHPEESYLRDGYAIQYGFCPECCNLVIQLQHGMSLGWNENGYWVDQIDEEQLIYPRYATARKLHEFIPHQYAELFRESEEVNNISPRASATLSRYLLQMLLHEELHIHKRNLEEELKELEGMNNVPSKLVSMLQLCAESLILVRTQRKAPIAVKSWKWKKANLRLCSTYWKKSLITFL